jgi:hypothetical protein
MTRQTMDDIWNDEHDPLDVLADVPDQSIPPVEQVHSRAGTIRRQRRRARVGVSVGALATALVIGAGLAPQDDGGVGNLQAASFLGIARAQAADGVQANCLDGVGYTTRFTREQWSADPQVAALASWLPADATGLPVRGIDVTSNQRACPPPVPAAVLYTETPAKQGLTLWSDVARPFTGQTGLENVDLRGTTAELLDLPGNILLSWREGDGTRWVAQASGIDQASILSTLDSLTLRGTTLDGASVPASWEQAQLPEPTNDPNVLSWDVEYGQPGDGSDDPGIRLQVARESEPVAAAAARGAAVISYTRVNGQLAVFWTDEGGCLSWDSAGLAYQLCGSQDLDRLGALAARVARVEPTDPRVQIAPDLFDTSASDSADGN